MADAERDIAEILAALDDADGLPRATSILRSWGDAASVAHRELSLALADRLPADPVREIGYQARRPPLVGGGSAYQLLQRTVSDLARQRSGSGVLPMLLEICHRLAARGLHHVLRSTVWEVVRIHPWADVLEIFRHDDPREPQESWTVLLHEYVAHGNDLSDDPAVAHYLAILRESGHQLGMLPAQLVEGEPPARGSKGFDFVEPPLKPLLAERPRPADIERRFEDAVDGMRPWERRALLAPYELWLAMEANTRVDAAVVYFDEPIDVIDVDGDSLRRLSIASMSGLTPPILRRMSVSSACVMLQSNASHGPSYGSPLGEAYGRFAKWQCIAALAGVDLGVDPIERRVDAVETIMRRAEQCTWWRFWDTRWFHGGEDSMGGGLAALRRDGRSLAVVAASDIP